MELLDNLEVLEYPDPLVLKVVKDLQVNQAQLEQ